jgi:hypothetical protein
MFAINHLKVPPAIRFFGEPSILSQVNGETFAYEPWVEESKGAKEQGSESKRR